MYAYVYYVCIGTLQYVSIDLLADSISPTRLNCFIQGFCWWHDQNL